jgi:toxin HigB-1
MLIKAIKHKGLKNFVTRNDSSLIPASSCERIRNIISYLQDSEDISELKLMKTWSIHKLNGNRKGTWSVTVTRNWRLTFTIDVKNKSITDLNLEDYH